MAGRDTSDAVTAQLLNAPTLDGDGPGELSAGDSQLEVQTSRIGRFSILSKLGSGGMGSVFAAYDEEIDRKVALKLLHKAQAGNAVQRQRAMREARAAARILHPNVVAIYEVGELDGNIHIAMEYVDGGTLLDWQSRSDRSWQDILPMYLQVGAALQAAHEADVVHRDFKPDNVLIGEDERPRVVDFGLARIGWAVLVPESKEDEQAVAADVDSQNLGRITRPGVVFGTPGYMSPEQYRGGDIDSRSDQWSFCAALYEALYGHLPFSGSNLREHEESVSGPPCPPPSDTKVPDEIRQALFRGLSAEPAQRFSSMAELIASLTQELRGDVAGGRLARRRFSIGLIGAVCLAFWAVQLRHQQSSPPQHATGIIWAVLIVLMLLGGRWHRQTLLLNRFHRHIWIVILVTLMAFLAHRLVGNSLGLSVAGVFPIQMITLASTMAILAATLIRSLYFLPAIPLVACLLALTSTIPLRWLSLAYPLTAICLAFGWDQAGKRQLRSIGEPPAAATDLVQQRRERVRQNKNKNNRQRETGSSDDHKGRAALQQDVID